MQVPVSAPVERTRSVAVLEVQDGADARRGPPQGRSGARGAPDAAPRSGGALTSSLAGHMRHGPSAPRACTSMT